MSNHRTLCAVGLMLAFSRPASAQLRPPPRPEFTRPIPESASSLARRALPDLQRLVTDRTFRGLGFRTPEEARSIALGAPLRVFSISLDRLRAYRPGARPDDLLVETGEVLFPTQVGGETRAALVVRQVKMSWEVVSFGKAAMTASLAKAVRVLAARETAGAGAPFEVAVPALNVFFAGRSTPRGLELAPLVDDPRFHLAAGTVMAAEDVVARLAPFALKMKTGPFVAD